MHQSYSKIIAKAWKDPAFKKKLKANPKEALKEMGIKIPENCTCKVVENTSTEITLVIPAAPQNAGTIGEAELEKMAAGVLPWQRPDTDWRQIW